MFEHFRVFFLATFQLNLAMYCLPISVRFSGEPLLVSVVLLGLVAVFKSYPGLGEVGFFLVLLPIFSSLLPFLKQVTCYYLCKFYSNVRNVVYRGTKRYRFIAVLYLKWLTIFG
jgi:phosphatidylinositol glycan class U